MKKLFRFLGSIYLALFLIALTALFVILGTLIESYTGSHLLASRFTYSSPLFLALLAGFFVNILVSALLRFPFKKKHIPFLITHLGLLMIILGAFIKITHGTQGNMGVFEGSGSEIVFLPNTHAIRLENRDREVRYYPIKKDWRGILSIDHTLGFEDVALKLFEYVEHAKQTLSFQGKSGKWVDLDLKNPPDNFLGIYSYAKGFHGYKVQMRDFLAPLLLKLEGIPALKKLEDNLAAITFSMKEGAHLEFVSLGYDPYGSSFKWPVANGRYLASLECCVERIPYHLRLRDARAISYPDSNMAYSYESDVMITDKRDGSVVETTLRMNKVYETWDGYRFYLSNIHPKDATDVQQAIFVVNRDPAKYLLTYPGACFLFAGIILLFWAKKR